MKGLLARKIGMAQMANQQGVLTAVTLLEIQPNVILQIKTTDKDGKNAIVLGAGARNKVKKNTYANYAFIRQVDFASVEGLEKGGLVTIELFQVGDMINITGISKGKGFQGVVKRHGFKGNPDSHGHEDHREPGGFGGRTWPGRVSKGRKLPGHMGLDTVTRKNIPVIALDKEMKILAIKGPVPGGINSFVKIWQ